MKCDIGLCEGPFSDPICSSGTNRFLIILADSGMGKTAFLLNYYAWHRRRWWWQRRGIELKHVALNEPDAWESFPWI